MPAPIHPPKSLKTAALALAPFWLIAVGLWFYGDNLPLPAGAAQSALMIVQWVIFLSTTTLAVLWIAWARRVPQRIQNAVYTVAYLPIWQLLVFFADAIEADTARVYIARLGLGGLFVIGLLWVVWGVERASRYYALRRESLSPEDRRGRIWNPLDEDAWYYGRESRRLLQSMTAFCSYSLAFLLAVLLVTSMRGCSEIYELPAGGGEQKQLVQQVKVQKVIRKKFVINPFSAIVFNPPPIDEIKLKLMEVTDHTYKVGYGSGKGAGFAGGTNRGKVRFIRLEYAGGDWNQDFGVGADVNMLIEYGTRTSQNTANRTEARSVAQLSNFPIGKSPPFVYLTGQRNISLSRSEVKTLREYLTDKHGMLFGDNGGSSHFHRQFVRMMSLVLPNVEPVAVPLDDPIHRLPYQIPFLPYVAPHGGKEALGWKVDGRWVCYYHPGDIADAWADGHAGVSPEIAEYCYQLGTNVIFYAHSEYAKWLEARQKN